MQAQIDRHGDVYDLWLAGRLPSKALATKLRSVASRLDRLVARYRALPRYAAAKTYVSYAVRELGYSARSLRAYARFVRDPSDIGVLDEAEALYEGALRYLTRMTDEHSRLHRLGVFQPCG